MSCAAAPHEAPVAPPARHLTAEPEPTAQSNRWQAERVAGARERESAVVLLAGTHPAANLARRRTMRLPAERLERVDEQDGEQSDVATALHLAARAALRLAHARSAHKNRTSGPRTPAGTRRRHAMGGLLRISTRRDATPAEAAVAWPDKANCREPRACRLFRRTAPVAHALLLFRTMGVCGSTYVCFVAPATRAASRFPCSRRESNDGNDCRKE